MAKFCPIWSHWKEGRIQVLVGLAPSSQTVGYLLRTPRPALAARENLQKIGWVNAGEISYQFLPPGGCMGPRYVLQLLYSEKSQNC
jgi:hypothetical protein